MTTSSLISASPRRRPCSEFDAPRWQSRGQQRDILAGHLCERRKAGMAEAADSRDLTLLLQRMQTGEAGATDALAEAVYEDLRAMARGHLGRDVGPQCAGVTIQPTMLANDTLMKLIRQRQQYDNTGHFFAIASRLMVRVLLDYHRIRNAQKRGRANVHVALEPEHGEVVPDEREREA